MPSAPTAIDLTRLPAKFEIRLAKSDFALIAATDAPDVPSQEANLQRLIADAKLHDVGELHVVLHPDAAISLPPGAAVAQLQRTPDAVRYRLVFAWEKFGKNAAP